MRGTIVLMALVILGIIVVGFFLYRAFYSWLLDRTSSVRVAINIAVASYVVFALVTTLVVTAYTMTM